ncbi:MAG TPA: hypothetical protein PK156_10185 [Polyangium sp.]|nr:hypothetical protein [Polyangium sp.]
MNRSLENLLFACTAAAATTVITIDAHADIDFASINQQGDLELEFRAFAPPTRQFQYSARASATTTFACPNAMFIRSTVTNVVNRNGLFTSDFQGRVNALLTLNIPPGQPAFSCPLNAQPIVKTVEYRQIEIRGELGEFHYGRDVIRNF